jgi:class 3 adenylate cyclase/tetratricopeptide (TPR) repeat protein
MGPPSAERRQLTVAFCDMVDSTGLAGRLDPEDWHELLSAYHRRVADTIESHGGTVMQFQGDGVIAYFGWPQNSDTSSRDALSAGLSVVSEVAELAGPDGERLAARVGIHTGVVVVVGPSNGGLNRPADVFGETPNLASRLQSVAGPGQVVVSDATAALITGWFELEPLGAHTLRGVTRPVDVFLVVAASGAHSRLDIRELTPFVGREAELATLEAHWRGALSLPARIVTVTGEPGIGKSRLVREFLQRIEPGPTVWTATCSRRDVLSPLHPFTSIMDGFAVRPAQVREWIVERATAGPCILVVEDLQWADPSTVETIALLDGTAAPVLVLTTARQKIASLDPDGGRTLTVDSLDAAEAEAVVSNLIDRPSLSADVRRRVLSRAGGVPLFLEELARSPADMIPATIADVILERLDRLGEAKRLAQQASVIGLEFDVVTLLAVTHLDEHRALGHLAQLVDHRVVAPSDLEGGYRFVHALLQEAAYGSTLRRERRRLHGLLADGMADAAGGPAFRPEVLAAHYGLAGRPGEAIAQWERAARRAARNSLYLEAAAHLTEALACLPQLPDDESRDDTETRISLRLGQFKAAIDQAAPEVGVPMRRALELATRRGNGLIQLEAQLSLAAHYQAAGDYPSAHRSLDGADELIRTVVPEWTGPAVDLIRGPILVWQGQVTTGQHVIARALKSAGIEIGEPLRPDLVFPGFVVAMVVGSYVVFGLGECLSGRADEAQRAGELASELAARHEAPHAQCMSWATRGIIHQLGGQTDAARSFAEKALQLADDRTTAQFRGWARALIEWADGRAPAPRSAEDQPTVFMRPYLLLLKADRAPDPHSALAALDEALMTARASGERFTEPELLRMRAVRQLEVGDRAGADRSLAEGLAVARQQGAVAFERRILATWRQTSQHGVIAEAGESTGGDW